VINLARHMRTRQASLLISGSKASSYSGMTPTGWRRPWRFRHRRRPLPVVPASWLGKGQLLYLGLLWTVVIFNFERAVVAFQTQRLVTEGVLYLVALACTLVLLLTSSRGELRPDVLPGAPYADERWGLRMMAAVGVLAAVFSIVADWGIVRAIYGDRFAGHAALDIRFGPRATINKLQKR
jgi:hypothetical protein